MIGVFDSGIGGLTVVRQLRTVLPNHEILYIGDTARAPYGNRSASQITRFACEQIDWLLEHGATSIVIACHTISTQSYVDLKKIYEGVPLFGMVNPVVVSASNTTNTGRIGLLATRATIDSNIYQERLIQYAKNRGREFLVFAQAAPLLVPLIEEGLLHTPETKRILKRYIRPLKQFHIDTLILGCTHYPLLFDLIQKKMGPKVHLIDPGSVMATEVFNYFKKKSVPEQSQKSQCTIALTEVHEYSKKIITTWLGERCEVLVADVSVKK